MEIPRAKPIAWAMGASLLLLGTLSGLLLAASFGQKNADETKQSVQTKPKTVVITGDIACDDGGQKTTFTCRHDDTATLISSLKPNAVLTAGDNQYPIGSLDSYLGSYDKTWGQFKDVTYPTPGNHEYGTPGAAGYFDYFGSRAGERGKGYYYYRVGEWLMIALNSEIDTSAGSDQYKWLEQVLEIHKSTCTLAYWHKPRFSTSQHGDNPQYDALWRLLYAEGVDVIVGGHSHGYERFAPQGPDAQYDPQKGITQFVVGTGGHSWQPMDGPAPALVTRQNHAFGVLKLTLKPTATDYQFVPIAASQSFTDHGTIACH